jgi:hypothetical protein
MNYPSGTKNIFHRIFLSLALLLCLAFITSSVGAATTVRGSTTTTTSPFTAQRVITTVTTVPTTVPPVACIAPCSCMERSAAEAVWGSDGFSQCAEVPCAYERTASGAPVQKYCFHKKEVIPATTTFIPIRQQPVTTTPTPVSAQLAGAVGPTTPAPGAQQQISEKSSVTARKDFNPGPCVVNHGMGKGLADSENNTECVNVCQDVPMKPLPGKDDLINIFEKMKKDPGFFSQVITHPNEAAEDYNFRLTQKQVTLLAGMSGSDLRNGFAALSSESQQQLVAAGSVSGSGGSLGGSSICSGTVCTTTPTPDGIPDICDNCPMVVNPDQADTDDDSFGNACDNCPNSYNPDQADQDHDGFGDVCDLCPVKSCKDALGDYDNGDSDNDGSGNCCDNCKKIYNPGQQDADNDGAGDACDNCQGKDNPDQKDSDAGYIQQFCQNSNSMCSVFRTDNYGDSCDNCPFVYNPDQKDTDKDGMGDACDKCPINNNPGTADSDKDGIPDACDNCPNAWNPWQTDTNKDGTGDACDCNDKIKGPYEQGADCGVATDSDTVGHVYTAAGCPGQSCSACLQPGQTLPSSFSWTNWRGVNWMSPVKAQGSCGACWAFGPVGAAEGKSNIVKDNVNDNYPYSGRINLSEQWLVSGHGGAGGSCGGGWPIVALMDFKTNGVTTAYESPFLSGTCGGFGSPCDPTCTGTYSLGGQTMTQCSNPVTRDDIVHPNKGRGLYKINSYTPLDTTDRDTVKRALLCHGPLVVDSQSWKHVIVLVGWDDAQTDNAPGRIPGAWLIKNSWGAGGYGGGSDWKGDPILPGFGYIYFTGDPYSDIVPSDLTPISTAVVSDNGQGQGVITLVFFTRSPVYLDDKDLTYIYSTKGY